MPCFNLFYGMAGKKKETDPHTEEILKRLGERFRSLRIQKGYANHEHFANHLNIARSQYWSYEKGENLNFTTLVKVVKAMNMTLEEFFSEGFE